jgi:2-polyprenyl-6-methoxyphenol hydroxylase-like FAD-dependent oxidoreductase
MEPQAPSRSAQNDILIVGAGLAGLTLALALARKGIKSTVIEKQKEINASKWAILLYPVGMKIFQDLGILDDMKSLAMPLKDPQVDTAEGETLAVLQTGLMFGQIDFSLGLGPSEIRGVLRRHAIESGVEVVEGAKYLGLLRDKGGRITGARISSDDKESTITSSLLVGADGYKSQVRRDFATRTESKSYPPGLGMFLRFRHGLDRFHMVLADGCVVVLLPLSPDLLEIGFYARNATEEEWIREGEESAKRRMATVVPGLSQAIEGSDAKFSDESILIVKPEEIWAKTLAVDGGVLIGDAAHSFHPGVGQGAQQAFLDASMLAPVIENCLSIRDFGRKNLIEFEVPRLALMRFWKGNSRRLISTETASGRFGRWWKRRYFTKAGELTKNKEIQEIIWGFRAPTRAELLRVTMSLLV